MLNVFWSMLFGKFIVVNLGCGYVVFCITMLILVFWKVVLVFWMRVLSCFILVEMLLGSIIIFLGVYCFFSDVLICFNLFIFWVVRMSFVLRCVYFLVSFVLMFWLVLIIYIILFFMVFWGVGFLRVRVKFLLVLIMKCNVSSSSGSSNSVMNSILNFICLSCWGCLRIWKNSSS